MDARTSYKLAFGAIPYMSTESTAYVGLPCIVASEIAGLENGVLLCLALGGGVLRSLLIARDTKRGNCRRAQICSPSPNSLAHILQVDVRRSDGT